VNGIHEVTGSIPVSSTNSGNNLRNWPWPLKARRVSGGSVFSCRSSVGYRKLRSAIERRGVATAVPKLLRL
jgi:hypothetical protein